MTQYTITQLEAAQKIVERLLEEAKAQVKKQIHFPEQVLELAPGERYAGIVTGKEGEAPYHLILLPGEAEDITWPNAKAWGELPTRREQALLFANLKEEFEECAYWSAEQHVPGSSCAWYQNFHYGFQDCTSTASKLRARAVRRSVF